MSTLKFYKELYTQLKFKALICYPQNYQNLWLRIRIIVILSNFFRKQNKSYLIANMNMLNEHRKDEKDSHFRLTPGRRRLERHGEGQGNDGLNRFRYAPLQLWVWICIFRKTGGPWTTQSRAHPEASLWMKSQDRERAKEHRPCEVVPLPFCPTLVHFSQEV